MSHDDADGSGSETDVTHRDDVTRTGTDTSVEMAGGPGVSDPGLDPRNRSFGWRGWVLVVAIVASFVVVPTVIVLRPPGLPYWFSMLILPILPGVVLGVVAVWAAIRS